MPVTGNLETIKATTITATGLTDEFIDDVDLRLQSLGYTVSESDSWAVAFAVQSVVNRIKNECNIAAVPEGLIQVAVDMVCGEFLLAKKSSGGLEGFNVDLNSAALKQTQSGDTNVVFAVEGVNSAEQRLDTVIKWLINYGKSQFITYRRIKWT